MQRAVMLFWFVMAIPTISMPAGYPGGWCSGVSGPGKAVDTEHHFVIVANMLGSVYGSTGRPALIQLREKITHFIFQILPLPTW